MQLAIFNLDLDFIAIFNLDLEFVVAIFNVYLGN